MIRRPDDRRLYARDGAMPAIVLPRLRGHVVKSIKRISRLVFLAQGQHIGRLKSVQECTRQPAGSIRGPHPINFRNNANVDAAASMACGLQLRRNGNRPGPIVGVKQR
jgi:hypothetical protein